MTINDLASLAAKVDPGRRTEEVLAGRRAAKTRTPSELNSAARMLMEIEMQRYMALSQFPPVRVRT